VEGGSVVLPRNNVVRAEAGPRALGGAMKVHRLRCEIRAADVLHDVGRGSACIHGELVYGVNLRAQVAVAKNIGAHVDGVTAHTGVGVIEKVRAGGHRVSVPALRGVIGLADRHAIFGSVAVHRDDVTVLIFVIQGVGIECSRANAREEVVEIRLGDHGIARLVVNLEGRVDRDDDVIGAYCDFGIRRHTVDVIDTCPARADRGPKRAGAVV